MESETFFVLLLTTVRTIWRSGFIFRSTFYDLLTGRTPDEASQVLCSMFELLTSAAEDGISSFQVLLSVLPNLLGPGKKLDLVIFYSYSLTVKRFSAWHVLYQSFVDR